jgi:hypothetical protein
MKEETQQSQKNTGNLGGGVFAWGGKAFGKVQMPTKRSLCQRKTEGGLEKWLANLWSRKKITKEAHAGRGQETKWGMSAKKHHHWSIGANSSPPRLCLRLALRRLGR